MSCLCMIGDVVSLCMLLDVCELFRQVGGCLVLFRHMTGYVDMCAYCLGILGCVWVVYASWYCSGVV